jgi:hypothetical protein
MIFGSLYQGMFLIRIQLANFSKSGQTDDEIGLCLIVDVLEHEGLMIYEQ